MLETIGNTVPQSSRLIGEMHGILRNRGIGILHKVVRRDVDVAVAKARIAGFPILQNEHLPSDDCLYDLVIQKLSTPKERRGKK